MKKNFICVGVFGGLLLAGAMLSGADAPGDAKKGKDVFENNCDVCHNADSADTKVGPGLKGLFKRQNFQSDNNKKVTDANVLAIINEGSPAGMPGFADQISTQQRADLLAFLKTL